MYCIGSCCSMSVCGVLSCCFLVFLGIWSSICGGSMSFFVVGCVFSIFRFLYMNVSGICVRIWFGIVCRGILMICCIVGICFVSFVMSVIWIMMSCLSICVVIIIFVIFVIWMGFRIIIVIMFICVSIFGRSIFCVRRVVVV